MSTGSIFDVIEEIKKANSNCNYEEDLYVIFMTSGRQKRRFAHIYEGKKY